MRRISILGIFAALLAFGINAFAQKADNFLQKDVIIKHRINPDAKTADSSDKSEELDRIKASLTTGGTSAVSPLIYHNGALINQPVIYIIWYGNWNQTNGSDTPAGQQLIRDWANSIGGTPHFNLNTSLSVPNYPISGSVAFGGESVDRGTRTSLTDTNIRTIVSNAITSGRLPYNYNGVYFVVTSSNVTASSGFCTQYCGWHTSTTLTGYGTTRYSFIGNAKRCLSSCAAQSVSPNNNPGIDGSISVMTHELEETTTDPEAGWYASNGQENGDECAWTFGHYQFQTSNGSWANMTFGGHNWLIQRNILKSGSSFLCMVDSTHN